MPEPCLRAASESDGRRNQSRCFSDTFDWINNDEQIALGTEGIKAGTGLRFPFPSLVSAPVSLIDSCTARGAQLCKCLCILHCSPRCWGSLCQQPPWGAGGAVAQGSPLGGRNCFRTMGTLRALGNFPTPPEISSSSMSLWACRDIPEGRSPISTREVSLWPLTKEASRVCLGARDPQLCTTRRLVGDGISQGSDACPPFFLPFRMNKRSFLGTWVALLVMTVRHQGEYRSPAERGKLRSSAVPWDHEIR